MVSPPFVLGAAYATDRVRIDRFDRRSPELPHRVDQLAPHQLEDAFDPRLTEGREPPDVGASDADGGRAEGEGRDDVGPAAKSAVHENRDSARDGGGDLGTLFSGNTVALTACSLA